MNCYFCGYTLTGKKIEEERTCIFCDEQLQFEDMNRQARELNEKLKEKEDE